MAKPTNWQLNQYDTTLLDIALKEDLGEPYRCITSHQLFKTDNRKVMGAIRSKNPTPIVLSGMPMVREIFNKLDTHFELISDFYDGMLVDQGQTIVSIQSSPETILMGERVALNFLRHLSSISTFTKKFVDKVKHTKLKILDTRKTTPGFRHLEKYAVQCGGGVNHREGLYDAMMVKDTHVDLIGSVQKTLEKLPSHAEKKFPVIFEVRSLFELEVILSNGLDKVDRVLLDNMSSKQWQQASELCRGMMPTEVSGGVNLNSITTIAESGVDFASVGMITYGAAPIDLHMKTDEIS